MVQGAHIDQDIEILPEEPEHDVEQGAADPGGEVQIIPPPAPPGEVRKVRILPKPLTTTRAQREEHELTHVTFAPWCRHCVMSGR